MKIILQPADEAEWLAMRRQDVTSTEAAALFGLSPYTTEFEVWHQKKSGEEVAFTDNERMAWGRRLEPTIAQGVAEDQGWTVEPFKTYVRDDEVRMGSSFDFRIIDTERGDGILEIKNVDRSVFAKKWIEHEDGEIEAPEHIEMQVQHQMEVADMNWCVIAALVGGNELKMIHRKRDRAIGKAIRKKVTDFWQSIADDRQPQPDYERDYQRILNSQIGDVGDDVIEADQDLDDLVAEYVLASTTRKDAEAAERVAKAKIMERVGTASKLRSAYGTLSCGVSGATQGKLITAEMVGTYTGARKAFRNFRFTPAKLDQR